jgi:hypothetical protein
VVAEAELQRRVAELLWIRLKNLRPTPSFRRRAWREFQRALDPLAAPRPLPRVHA